MAHSFKGYSGVLSLGLTWESETPPFQGVDPMIKGS